MNTQKNCWSCKFQQMGGDNFFGNCLYFESIGKEKKEIPKDIIDVGCRFYIDKEESSLVKEAIKIFDGELI